MLEGGKFFVAAQVVVFCQLRLFLAELLNQLAPAFCRSFTLFALQFAFGQGFFELLTFLLQFLQSVLTAAEFLFQGRLNALRLLGLKINALGIDKADFLYGFRRRSLVHQPEAQ